MGRLENRGRTSAGCVIRARPKPTGEFEGYVAATPRSTPRPAQIWSIARCTWSRLQHDYGRPLGDPPIEIDHVGVHHADASGRHGFADRVGLIGPVDAEQRVLLAFKQVERPRAERIFHAAIHMHRQAALSRQHFRWRGPSGPKRLPPDLGQSFPGEALAPDADPVLQRPTAALREIELAFARIDGERARRLARRIIDLLTGEAGHVDFIVETARRRVVGVRVRRHKGLRVGRRRRALASSTET